MKALLVVLLLFCSPVFAKVLAVATHPVSKEVIQLHDVKGSCPAAGKAADYFDPRDGEKAEGCYVMEDGSVFIIFRNGSRAGQLLVLPQEIFKPEI
jgi:hypothetical protein